MQKILNLSIFVLGSAGSHLRPAMSHAPSKTLAPLLTEISATELAKNMGDALASAERGPVGVTKHGKTRYVLLSLDRYERLVGRADTRVAAYPHEAPADLAEALLKSLPGGENR